MTSAGEWKSVFSGERNWKRRVWEAGRRRLRAFQPRGSRLSSPSQGPHGPAHTARLLSDYR